MICKNCGAQLKEYVSFCPECGAKQDPLFHEDETINAQNNTMIEKVNVLPGNQNNQNVFRASEESKDGKNWALNILCWFFPIVGFILYAMYHKEMPIRSKSNLKTSILSIVIGMIFVVFIVGIAFFSIKHISSTPGAHFNVNGEEYIVGEDGIPTLADEYYSAFDAQHISDLSEYKTVYVNGTAMTMPISSADFLNAVSEMDFNTTGIAEYTLQPNEVKEMTIYQTNGDARILITVINDTDDEMPLEASKIISLGVDTGYLYYDESVDIAILGIRVGTSVDKNELISKLGKPTTEKNIDYTTETTLVWITESAAIDEEHTSNSGIQIGLVEDECVVFVAVDIRSEYPQSY